MVSRISGIFPYFLITLLCVGGVEMFYFVVERFLLAPERTAELIVPEEAEVQGAPQSKPSGTRLDYSVITRRNLFGPPPQDKNAAEQAASTSKEEPEATQLEVVLMGTVQGVDGDSRAIILNKTDGKQEIYHVGDSLQGAEIKEIHRGKVILRVNDKDEMLDMSEASKYSSTATRPPAAVNPSVRRGRTVAPPLGGVEGAEGETTIKPRLVRPTRRIVRPRPVTEIEPAEQSGQNEPDQFTEPEEQVGQEELIEQDDQAESAIDQLQEEPPPEPQYMDSAD